MKTLYLAGGCFWCISAFFWDLDGVNDVVSGYCGGDEINPTYEQVKSQATGHRETIKIEYDEAKVSPIEILEIFFNNVDPYDFGGQFIDKGYSYTLAFYYEDDEQKKLFEEFLNKKKEESGKDAAIAIEPYKQFYEAEPHHQKFCMRHPEEFEKELIESGRKKK